MPGKPFEVNMEESVYNSYKVIAVFSKNLMLSNYCIHELDLAKYHLLKERDDSLVVMRIDKTNCEMLSRGLKKLSFMPIPWKNLSGKANTLSFWTPLMILMKNVWHKTKTMIAVSKRFYRRKSSEKNCLRKNNQYRYRSICYFRDRGNLCLRMWSRFIVVLIAIQVIVFWKKVSCYQRSKRSSGLNKLV